MRVLGLLPIEPPPAVLLPLPAALVILLIPALGLPCAGEKGSEENAPCCPLKGLFMAGLMRLLGEWVVPEAAEEVPEVCRSRERGKIDVSKNARKYANPTWQAAHVRRTPVLREIELSLVCAVKFCCRHHDC
jgi:hypothetical protein